MHFAFDPLSIAQFLGRQFILGYDVRLAGEVDERFKSHAWKACVG